MTPIIEDYDLVLLMPNRIMTSRVPGHNGWLMHSPNNFVMGTPVRVPSAMMQPISNDN